MRERMSVRRVDDAISSSVLFFVFSHAGRVCCGDIVVYCVWYYGTYYK